MLAGILLFPITGPLYGLRFIVEQIQAELDAELMDEGRLEAALMMLSMQQDLGEISDAEYAAQEAVLLQELNAVRAYKESLVQSGRYTEVDGYEDEEEYVLYEYESDYDQDEYEYDDEAWEEAQEGARGDAW